MDNKVFQKVFKELLEGTSVRELEKIYKFDRNKFISRCKEEFPEGSENRIKLEEILKYNKQNASTKTIETSKLEEQLIRLVRGETDLKQIAETMQVHKQTLNEKIEKFIENTNNQELREKFLEYQKRKHPDYSFINFRALVIEMIKTNKSQSDIAKKYRIPPRTISREIEKLRENDLELYLIAKEYSEGKMKRKPLNKIEIESVICKLDKLDNGQPTLRVNALSKEEIEYRKDKEILARASKMQGTVKEITEKLGISPSTLRRIKEKAEKYENTHKDQANKEIEGEEI